MGDPALTSSMSSASSSPKKKGPIEIGGGDEWRISEEVDESSGNSIRIFTQFSK